MTTKALAGRLTALEAHAGARHARVSAVTVGEPNTAEPPAPVTEAEWITVYGPNDDSNAQHHGPG